MLGVVVAVFAVLWLPFRGMLVYNSFAALFDQPKFMDLWFLMFAKTCVYINSAINPILYNAMSYKFRRAFHRFLACGWSVPPPRSAIVSLVTTTSSHQQPTLPNNNSNKETHF